MRRRRGRPGLATRLFAAQLLVILAGSLTLALTALALAPGLFRLHARQAFTVLPPDVTVHLEQGFQDAILLALGIAGAVSVVTALAASWLLAQRLTRPIRALAQAAERIGVGGYQARVALPTGGYVLAALSSVVRSRRALLVCRWASVPPVFTTTT